MFIRPMGAVVHPAEREPGRPLLRGLLARGAYVWDGGPPPPPAAAPGEPAPPVPWASAGAGEDEDEGEGGSFPEPPEAGFAPGGADAGTDAGAGRPVGPVGPVGPGAGAPAGAGAGVPAGAAAGAPTTGAGPAAAGAAAVPVHDLTDQLHRLAELAREGLLTPEEFSAAKSRLLKP
ncbi:SHOCT domain-containing protein [Streptomyces sp. NPDC048603]|uniref:SHOCT domain-containing protein n=1 Tax=Streptomyces sp. NPDC048603 TaxID=3365577 RepID=UPI003711A244